MLNSALERRQLDLCYCRNLEICWASNWLGIMSARVCFVCVRQQIGTFGIAGLGPPAKQTPKQTHTHSVEYKDLSVGTLFSRTEMVTQKRAPKQQKEGLMTLLVDVAFYLYMVYLSICGTGKNVHK